jgi:AcrR family transcriptional regulator
MNETKVRILDAAERLIAGQGLDVSLRAITAAAGVNLAAVNYHFQSKDALIDAIIARAIQPVNARRLEMLDALEQQSSGGPLPLEGVLRAFLAPLTEMDAEGREHIRALMGRIYSVPDEFIQRVFDRHLAPIAARFIQAFARAVPELSASERMWYMMFTIGAAIHVLNWSGVLPRLSSGLVDPSDSKTLTERLIAFTAAGFRSLQHAPQLEHRHA